MHMGIIPDGNRRYASDMKIDMAEGHKKGAIVMKNLISWCCDHDEIKEVSVFALAEANLKRCKEEKAMLWALYEEMLRNILTDESVTKKRIKINIYGDYDKYPPAIKKIKDLIHEKTDLKNPVLVLNVMLLYDGKKEIIRKYAQRGPTKRLFFVEAPVDLLIRTGGQHRLSNFMPYQNAYAEILFLERMWPDFTRKDLDDAMAWYHGQESRFGK